MPFTFTPMSDMELQEVKNRGLLADGIYPFLVKQAIECVSSSGNPMIKTNIAVTGKDGKETFVTDYLMTTTNMMYKLKHFCDAIGLSELYDAGSFEVSQFINRSGLCQIATQRGKTAENGSVYPDKNYVKDYIKRDSKTPAAAVVHAVDATLNDDLPF